MTPQTVQALRFHEYGEPQDVLRLEAAELPSPAAGQIRVTVYACGLAPADWALCRGLFPGSLPRGVGIDVSGVVEALGEGVQDVKVGERVVGNADWANCPSAGAAEGAIMNRWVALPQGLDFVQAAALPIAIDTAYQHLHWLGLEAGKTILINGAGTTIGYAAVQIALRRGLKVIATAGQTYAGALQSLGATVTPYGAGLVERVRALHPEAIDLVFDTAPVGGALPDLITLAGDPQRVLTLSDFEAAQQLGARDSFREDMGQRVDALGEFVGLAAKGEFSVPVARTFALSDWREALAQSLGGQARGKLLLLPQGHTV